MLRTRMSSTASVDALAHLRLWQLISPALPVGAYAYSQGMEYAVQVGWVADEDSAGEWIEGLLGHSLAHLDVPLLRRLRAAWRDDDVGAVEYWNALLLAARETSEIRDEDLHLGSALARLLNDLGVAGLASWPGARRATYACVFALACERWHIALSDSVEGYLWSWCENQVAAAIKLIPLGQTAGQRLLMRLMRPITETATRGLTLSDDEIGALAPGLALASALHETQYTRLFRS